LTQARGPVKIGAFDLLDEPVVALGAGVGDAADQKGVDLGPPGVDRLGERE
jgi:hypothetical protein